jgi:hypothetical protein
LYWKEIAGFPEQGIDVCSFAVLVVLPGVLRSTGRRINGDTYHDDVREKI